MSIPKALSLRTSVGSAACEIVGTFEPRRVRNTCESKDQYRESTGKYQDSQEQVAPL